MKALAEFEARCRDWHRNGSATHPTTAQVDLVVGLRRKHGWSAVRRHELWLNEALHRAHARAARAVEAEGRR